MSESRILGRGTDGAVDERALTTMMAEVEVEYVGGAIGKQHAKVFLSNDVEDRGGVVIRIETEDNGSSFIPYAINTLDGIEIHMAGDAEGRALLRVLEAIRSAIAGRGKISLPANQQHHHNHQPQNSKVMFDADISASQYNKWVEKCKSDGGGSYRVRVHDVCARVDGKFVSFSELKEYKEPWFVIVAGIETEERTAEFCLITNNNEWWFILDSSYRSVKVTPPAQFICDSIKSAIEKFVKTGK